MQIRIVLFPRAINVMKTRILDLSPDFNMVKEIFFVLPFTLYICSGFIIIDNN